MKPLLATVFAFSISVMAAAQDFSLRSALSYPFPSSLTACAKGQQFAWSANEQGRRNIYVAAAPDFSAHKITSYNTDDGQELTSITISNDGKWIVFVRGGDHGNRDPQPVNPLSSPVAAKVLVMSVPFSGGKVNVLGEGDNPVISPNSDRVVFAKDGQIMAAPVNGSQPAAALFYAKGSSGATQWSPDGSKLAFVSQRGDHSFIGIYTNEQTPIQWLLPAFSRDNSPRWSPDGKKIAFIRTPGMGGTADSVLSRKHQPWEIWTANVQTGEGEKIWKAAETTRGSFPGIDGGANLLWAYNRIVFMSYEDGWPHIYSIMPEGGNSVLLTSGDFTADHIRLTTDKKHLIFSANVWKEKPDLDRRHIYIVSVDKPDMRAITSGNGIETYPVPSGDGKFTAYLSATATRPLLPAISPVDGMSTKLIGEELIPPAFPKNLVTPKQVILHAADGGTVYCQLFEPKLPSAKMPAIVYVHGGPQRQMVLGWHHMDYYSIDYALNQYLASIGFTVLSVNYRLGTGYGYDFQRPKNAGSQGASEYLDVKAAGEWLAKQPQINPEKIGIYGGSYGGYLVALALGRDSRLFAAGVDIHGVNNRFRESPGESRETAPDAALASKLAKESSPISYLQTWTSPVLLIHADDDRNVDFSQSVDLARRFTDKKFQFEFLAIPDDTHHWMKFSNGVKVSEATADFLVRKLMK